MSNELLDKQLKKGPGSEQIEAPSFFQISPWGREGTLPAGSMLAKGRKKAIAMDTTLSAGGGNKSSAFKKKVFSLSLPWYHDTNKQGS